MATMMRNPGGLSNYWSVCLILTVGALVGNVLASNVLAGERREQAYVLNLVSMVIASYVLYSLGAIRGEYQTRLEIRYRRSMDSS